MPSAHEKARLAKKKEAAKKKGGKKAVDEVTKLHLNNFTLHISGA